MKDYEALHQQEGEGGERKEEKDGDDDGAGVGEETDDGCDVAESEVGLEAYLSHIVRIQTTEI